MHSWPWLLKAPFPAICTASSTSKSFSRMRGFLPPSSRAVRLKVLAAARATSWPALGPPVKETIRTRGSSAIWALRASSATGTTFSTPAGRPAWVSTSPRSRLMAGVWGEGFRMKLLPAAMA